MTAWLTKNSNTHIAQWSSLIYNTSARQEQYECNTSAIRATQVRHKWDTSETRVLHKRHECYTSATPTTRVRHEWKILILITTLVKTYFHTLIFIIWKVKDYKERNNFILRTIFENASFPCQNAFKKYTTKTKLFNGKSYIKTLYTRL